MISMIKAENHVQSFIPICTMYLAPIHAYLLLPVANLSPHMSSVFDSQTTASPPWVIIQHFRFSPRGYHTHLKPTCYFAVLAQKGRRVCIIFTASASEAKRLREARMSSHKRETKSSRGHSWASPSAQSSMVMCN